MRPGAARTISSWASPRGAPENAGRRDRLSVGVRHAHGGDVSRNDEISLYSFKLTELFNRPSASVDAQPASRGPGKGLTSNLQAFCDAAGNSASERRELTLFA